MVQATKKASTSATETQEEVPTEVNEQSKQVSEDACCVLADIDSLLDEVVEPVLNEWDQEYDPNGSRPNRDAWEAEWNRLDGMSDYIGSTDLWREFRRRDKQWHAVRGLDYNSCVC